MGEGASLRPSAVSRVEIGTDFLDRNELSKLVWACSAKMIRQSAAITFGLWSSQCVRLVGNELDCFYLENGAAERS